MSLKAIYYIALMLESTRFYSHLITMQTDHTIFYSWQSDLPPETNQRAVRHTLRDSINLVESEIDDIKIVVDEATRDMPGSPNIPMTIFDKIARCDIFVCDVTTINSTSPKEYKRVPNPNVLIELGYAIAMLGFERIIILFNTVHGKFPDDIPFDIDRQRTTKFNIKDKDDKQGKSQLAQDLKNALKIIIEKSPLKPHECVNKTPEQIRRSNDIETIKSLLEAISIPAFEKFLDKMPASIPDEIWNYWNAFRNLISKSTFHIYDTKLLELVKNVYENWEKSLSFSQYYFPVNARNYSKFESPTDTVQSQKARKDFERLSEIGRKLEKDFKAFITYIKENYLEIDVNTESNNAELPQ
jgi:hypothetical protein